MGPSLVECIFPFSKLPYCHQLAESEFQTQQIFHIQSGLDFSKAAAVITQFQTIQFLGRFTFTLLTPEYFTKCTKGRVWGFLERGVTCNLHLYTVKWLHLNVNYELLKIRRAAQDTRPIAVFGSSTWCAKDWGKRISHEYSEMYRVTECCCSAREQRCFGVRAPSLRTLQHDLSQQKSPKFFDKYIHPVALLQSFTRGYSESMPDFFRNTWKSSMNISRLQVWKEMSWGIAGAPPRKRNPCRIPQECRKTLQLFPIFFLLFWWLLIFMEFTFHLSFL